MGLPVQGSSWGAGGDTKQLYLCDVPSDGHLLLRAGGWRWMVFRVPSNPTQSNPTHPILPCSHSLIYDSVIHTIP